MISQRPLRWGFFIVIALVPGGPASNLYGQTRPAPRQAVSAPLVDATHNIMQVEEVALKGDTPVFGDASKPGTYFLRKRLTANQTTRPHYDDQDRWITVLKGTLWVAKGDVFKPDTLLPIREGGLIYLPANTHYFAMAGDTDVILQISGTGPVKAIHTEVDAKGAPVPENGPYPVITAGKRRNMPIDPDLIDPDQQEQMERAAAARKAAADAAKAKAAPPAAAEPKK
jgi:hypothetical protein